jgi:hypothetical protein
VCENLGNTAHEFVQPSLYRIAWQRKRLEAIQFSGGCGLTLTRAAAFSCFSSLLRTDFK